MKNRILPALFALLLTGCEPPPVGTAITNVTVIDAVNGVRPDQTVVFIEDEIISIAAAGGDLNAIEIIDGTGKFLIPGLWDFHVHLTYDDRLTESMPALFLSYGITSVRDTGGLMEKVLPIVESMRADGALAPRVYFAGPLLDGGYVVYDGGAAPALGVSNPTPEDARERIKALHGQGIDFIKVYEMVSPEVFDAMVETANELNLPVDSHVPLSLRASEIGESLDALEHLRNLEMDCTANAAEMLEIRRRALENDEGLTGAALRSSLHQLQRIYAIRNFDEQVCEQTLTALQSTVQVPTLRLVGLGALPSWERDDWGDALDRVPPAVREEWQQASGVRSFAESPDNNEYANWVLSMIQRMHARDIPIAAGTDTPIFIAVPGYSLHAELEQLVRAGLTPLEALESATLRPAEFFSLENELGTIDAGMRADLVLLDANPLDDIRNTRNITGVAIKGTYFTHDELRERIPTTE